MSVNCALPVPPNYRKAELTLNRYISSSTFNPIIYSLLNVLVHVKQSKGFITDEAIEMALENIKKFDQETNDHTEPLLREIIYGTNCKPDDKNCSNQNQYQMTEPTPDIKQRIVAALDRFFENNDVDDY
ncbi:unnamed protein product [Adineta steineri]|uniref:Uncharacterized protein n=1 Tax=Adineta steineri TaxID=433720 RepID=A0A815BQ66_9BILA|nr:unnamed protein product [Adineta steineri]CAF1252132.1 unnamed protein product [Adineta steineri]CAF1276613.1 unnamed protein product [Adineta steineri]